MAVDETGIPKIMADLGVKFTSAYTAMKEFETKFDTLSAKVANTNLIVGGAVSAKDSVAKTTAAQQSKEQAILQESSAKKTAIVAMGEAKITAIKTKEALAQQNLLKKQAQTETAIIQKQLAQQKLAYIQARETAFTQRGTMNDLLQRRASWMLSGGLVFGGLAGMGETLSTIKDVELGMTTIARVTEDVNFNFKGMRDELQQLGVTYGDTWGDVSDIAIKWAQAGYNQAETLELTKDSLLALNTAELNSEQATSGLIAVMAQWGLTTEELLPTIDKINKVADDYAVTSTDLVGGLQRSSGAAKVLGLTLNETIAILTVMREATGRTGKEVGNALNSILSFMQRDKAIGTFEDMGIQVFADKARTQFRNVIEIFDEMAAKWPQMGEAARDALTSEAEAAGLFSEEMSEAVGLQGQWNDLQQRDLSQAAAGVYRRNYLLALLQNWSKVDEVLISQEQSLGYSMKENERTMQTLDKQIEVLKASAEQLAVALGDAGLLNELKSLVEGVTDVVQWFNNLDDTTQMVLLTLTEVTIAVKLLTAALKAMGVTGAISAIGGIMSGWAVPIGAATVASRGLLSALTGITTLVSNLGKGFIAALGGPVVAGIIGVTTAIIAVTRHASQMNQEIAEHGKIAEGLVGKYDTLTSRIQGMQAGTEEYNKTAKELREVKDGIADSLPELIEGYDKETNSIIINRKEMGNLINASKELGQANIELQGALETELELLRDQEQSHNSQSQYYETQKGVIKDLSERRDKLTATLAKQSAGSEKAQKTQEALGETERLIGDIAEEVGLQRNAAVSDVISKLNELKNAELQGVLNTQQAERDKVAAVKEGALARIKIIQEEMAAYGNAGSWNFTQAVGNFVKDASPDWYNMLNYDPDNPSTIRYLNQDNRKKLLAQESVAAKDAQDQMDAWAKKMADTENKINDIKANIATGGPSGGSGGGGGGKSQIESIDDYIDALMREADAQERLNDAAKRGLSVQESVRDLHMASAMTAGEYFQGLKMGTSIIELYREQQAGVHKEADLYRAANEKLREAQSRLDTSTEEGREAFDKYSEAIAKNEEAILGAQEAHIGFEKIIRDLSGQDILKTIEFFERMSDIGIGMSDEMESYLSGVDLDAILKRENKLAVLEKMKEHYEDKLSKKVEDRIALIEKEKEAYKQASDARIAAIQAEIDALEEESDREAELKKIEEARQSIADARLGLDEAEAKLENVEAEQNTRIFRNGRFEYIADPQAVKDAQKEVKSAQEALIEARKSYNETMEAIDDEHRRKELENQLKAEKEKQEKALAAYDQQSKDLKDWFDNDFLPNWLAGDEAVSAQLQADLAKWGFTMDEGLSKLLDIARKYFGQIRSQAQSAIDLMAEAGMSTPIQASAASGGYFPKGLVTQLHDNEYVLNSRTVNALGGASGVDAMVASVLAGHNSLISGAYQVVNNSASTSTASAHIDRSVNLNGPISFPHIMDVSGLIRNLKQFQNR